MDLKETVFYTRVHCFLYGVCFSIIIMFLTVYYFCPASIFIVDEKRFYQIADRVVID